MRILVFGWSSVLHGEATAGDVLAMTAVSERLAAERLDHDLAWSRIMCPPGGLMLDDADPADYSHVVFTCGPLRGAPVQELRERFAACRFLAVDVTVFPDDPLTGTIDRIIPRDGPSVPERRDLAALVPTAAVPMAAVYLTGGQHEYADRRRHDVVTELLEDWLGSLDAARLDLDTRLDPRDWRLAHTPAQVATVIARADVVITMRMHALVLGLGAGTPVLAVDPVSGGGKVSAQARAWQWPAVLTPESLTRDALDHWWAWCLSDSGRHAAATAAGRPPDVRQLDALVANLTGGART